MCLPPGLYALGSACVIALPDLLPIPLDPCPFLFPLSLFPAARIKTSQLTVSTARMKILPTIGASRPVMVFALMCIFHESVLAEPQKRCGAFILSQSDTGESDTFVKT